MRRKMLRDGRAEAAYFESGAFGWFLRSMFFPSGVVTLLLVCLLLKRNFMKYGGDFSGDNNGITSDDINNNNDHNNNNDGKNNVNKMEEDIERICSSLKVQRMVQRELEKCGRIDSNSCGYCLGEGVDSGYVKLPCGHYHHRSCVKFALRKGIIKCADCGDCIVKS